MHILYRKYQFSLHTRCGNLNEIVIYLADNISACSSMVERLSYTQLAGGPSPSTRTTQNSLRSSRGTATKKSPAPAWAYFYRLCALCSLLCVLFGFLLCPSVALAKEGVFCSVFLFLFGFCALCVYVSTPQRLLPSPVSHPPSLSQYCLQFLSPLVCVFWE